METKTEVSDKPATLQELLTEFNGDFPDPPEDAPRHEIRTMKDLFCSLTKRTLRPL